MSSKSPNLIYDRTRHQNEIKLQADKCLKKASDFFRASEIENAVDALKQAATIEPNAERFLELLNVLIRLKRIDEVQAVLDEISHKGILRLVKNEINDSDDFLGDLPSEIAQKWTQLYEQKKYEDLIDQIRLETSLFEKSPWAYNLLGLAYVGLKRQKLAITSFRKAIELNIFYPDPYNNFANVQTELTNFKLAIQNYKKAISLKSNFTQAWFGLGLAHFKNSDADQALVNLNRAVELQENYADAHKLIGEVSKFKGDMDHAKASFTKASKLAPRMGDIHRQLGTLINYSEDRSHLNTMLDIEKQAGLTQESRWNLLHAIGKGYEDLKDYDKAFDYYQKCGALRKQMLDYKFAKDQQIFGEIRASQHLIAQNALDLESINVSKIPIFVVGMPRSGTTLTEKILSSHPDVFGAGELPFVNRFGRGLITGSVKIDKDSILSFREKYLNLLKVKSDGSTYVVDKMPHNFRYISLLLAAFPEARIVHMVRSPAATCWSNFKTFFSTFGLGYSWDLNDLVSFYNLYYDLMSEWRRLYPNKFYDLDYDQLTIDQENQTKALIEFVGVDWNEACLSPEKNKRGAHTASQQQVKKRVYQGSSEQWRKFESHLNKYFQKLPD